MQSSETPNPTPSYQAKDFLADLKDWCDTCPLFSKTLIYLCSILCVLSVLGNIDLMLANEPARTIGSFQITRLIFSPFVFDKVIELIAAFIFYLPMVSTQEKENGTLHTLLDFFLKNLEINIVFIIVCYLLSSISNHFLNLQAYGLWCIYFAYLAEQILADLEGTTQLLSFPIQIPNKFYLVLLALLFSIISNTARLDIIVSAFVGFLNMTWLNPFFAELLNRQRVTSWEASSVMAWLKTFSNYIPLGSMSGPLLEHNNDEENNPNYPPIGNYNGTQGSEDEQKNKENLRRKSFEEIELK